MTESEIQAQKLHDEMMGKQRQEFRAAWPDLWKRIQPLCVGKSDHAAQHHAAWLVWLAARGIKQPNHEPNH